MPLWVGYRIRGSSILLLAFKSKALKVKLKAWDREVFKNGLVMKSEVFNDFVMQKKGKLLQLRKDRRLKEQLWKIIISLQSWKKPCFGVLGNMAEGGRHKHNILLQSDKWLSKKKNSWIA